MNTELFNQIKIWLTDNRPELNSQAILDLTNVAYSDIAPDVVNLEPGARNLFATQALKLRFLNSAYNLVKDVFQEEFPSEYSDYEKTPIFFEINEEILANCVHQKIFTSYDEVFSVNFTEDLVVRTGIKNVIFNVLKN